MRQRTSILGTLPPTQPVTKWTCILIIAVSLISALSDRKLGLGASDLIFAIDPILAGQIWRCATYAFVEHNPIALALSVLMVWIFGRLFEHKWGSKDFLKFMVMSSIGAAILAIPLSYILNIIMPFDELGLAQGPSPALDALIVSLAVTAPNSNILFGFVLPIPTKTLVYFMLGFEIVTGILTGTATLGITLGGMLMGYFLTTGNWRPQRLASMVQLWNYRRRRRGLRVVPNNRDRTLH